MKKLFKLVTLMVVMLLTAAPELFAANIIIKTPKIKKKNPKISNPIPPERDTCQSKFDINDLTITTTTETSSKAANYTNFGFSFKVDAKQGSIPATVEIEIAVTDCNGIIITKTITCVYNAITGRYEADYKLISSPECPLTLSETSITIDNPCGRKTLFEVELDKNVKGNGKDSCNTNYNLKEVNYQTQNVFGYYVMSFDFDFGKKGENPDVVEMIVQVTNCFGKTLNIKIKLVYNPNTGQYACTQAIPQDKDCLWALTYAEVYGTNPCGNMDTWAVDFDKIKTNGTGTRSGAASTKGGKPVLK